MLGVYCYMGSFLVAVSRDSSPVAVHWLLIVVACLAAERRLSGARASVVVAPGP